MLLRHVCLVVVLVLAGMAAASAQDATVFRDIAWRDFYGAKTKVAMATAIDALIATKPTLADVVAGLERGDRWREKGPTGWRTLSIEGPDGEKRPHLAWVPESYDPTRPHPLIVDLHGAVSRTSHMDDDYLKNLRYRIGKLAEMHGALLLIPKGRRGAEWWTPVGAGNVLAAVRQMKRDYNVDDDRVFCGGFSDGASGSFYLALHHARTFAGFIPLCGHIRVAQAGGAEVYLRNLRNRPLYVVNTGRDVLYPSDDVQPFIDAMKGASVDVVFRTFAEMPHAPLFVPEERGRIWAWMNAHPRPPVTAAVWVESATTPAHCDWLSMKANRLTGERWADDLNPSVTSRRVRLGIQPDRAYTDLGVKVKSVTASSLAASLGLKPDDVVVTIDEKPVADVSALSSLWRRKRPGQPIELGVYRGSELLSLSGTCPTPRPAPAFRRDFPEDRALLSGERKGNVITLRSARVQTVEIRLHHGTFDPARPVVVNWNGKRVYERVIEPDLRYVLGQAGVDRDRRRIWLADIVLDYKP